MASVDNLSTEEEIFDQPRTIGGIRLSAIIEILVFLSLAVLFNKIWGDGQRFISYSIHPFWIIILLATVQYGTLEGILSTILSTLFMYAGNVPPQKVGETFFDYEVYLAWTPTLWFVTAFILGEIRMRLTHINQDLRLKLSLAQVEAKTITEAYEGIRRVKENLEVVLSGQLKTTAMTFKTFKALGSLNPNLIILNLDQVIQPILNSQKFSVYSVGSNGLEPVSSYGWSDDETYIRRFPPDTALYREIVGNQRLLCIINPDDEKILSGEGLLAAPLIEPDTGEIFGMLKIEKMVFLDLNVTNLEAFSTLCELIGMAYANAKLHQKAEQNALYSIPQILLSYNFYTVQSAYLSDLAEQMHFPLTQMTISETRQDADFEEAIFYLLLKEVLPKTAQVFHGKHRVRELIVLFPGMDLKQVESYIPLIKEAVNRNEILARKSLNFNLTALRS